jgi:hypothetical protein
LSCLQLSIINTDKQHGKKLRSCHSLKKHSQSSSRQVSSLWGRIRHQFSACTPPIFCLHARLVNLVTVAFSYPNRPFVACWEQQGYASQSHNTRRSLRSNRTRISMADAPQVAYAGAYPEVHNETPPSKHHEVYNDTVPSKHHGPPSQDIRAYHHPEENSIQKLRRTILGMRRRNFWILLAIALVIVAATIGGSVGGSMAVRNSRYNCH